jgi:hypothetical protein
MAQPVSPWPVTPELGFHSRPAHVLFLVEKLAPHRDEFSSESLKLPLYSNSTPVPLSWLILYDLQADSVVRKYTEHKRIFLFLISTSR